MAPLQGGHIQECLYEVLGVERSASADEVRSGYRKQALKWHPDKIQQSGASPEVYQEATVRFQLVSRAYEILSDPLERQWYDSHRSAILSSSTSSASATVSDYDFNVWPYFSPTAFSGYGESGKGFYAVYGEVFRKLQLQEQMFARNYGAGSVRDAPELKGPGTPYPAVAAFYHFWLGFSTVKDFGWCDEYDVLSAPSRKVRRLMEEDNNKIRKRKRREFNDSVRQFAAFVKKRDKRVMEKQLELQRLQKEKEQSRKLRQQQLEKERQELARLYKEQDWTIPDGEDDGEHSDDDGLVEDENQGSYDWVRSDKGKTVPKEDDRHEYYCIICGKRFRSDKQWKNHEKSKKHIERAASLKDAFLEEDEILEREQIVRDQESEVEVETHGSKQRERSEMEKASADDGAPCEEEVSDLSDLDEDASNAAHPTTARQQDIPNPSNSSLRSESVDGEDNDNDDEDFMLAAMLNSHRSRHKGASEVDENSNLRSSDEADELVSTEHVVDPSSRSKKGELLGEECVEHDEDQGDDDAMLAAMLNSQRGWQNGASADGDPSKDSSDMSVDSSEEIEISVSEQETVKSENQERGGSLGMAQTKRRIKQEKKNAAALDRHVSAAAELDSIQQLLKGASLGNENNFVTTDELTAVGGNAKALQRGRLQQNGSRETKEISRSKQNGGVDGRHSKAIPSLNERGKKGGKNKKNKGGVKQDSNTCETCGQDFDSRSQLFKHITATNHAILKSK